MNQNKLAELTDQELLDKAKKWNQIPYLILFLLDSWLEL